MSSKLASSALPTPDTTGQAQLVALAELPAAAGSGPALLDGQLGLLHGVPVTLSVVLGEAVTTVGELMALQQSAVLKVDRQADCPVDVMLNGAVVARGQLVVVDDHFGVRVSEIAPALRP